MKLNIAILTLSDTRSLENDTSGDYLQSQFLLDHHLQDRKLCKDNKYLIRALVSEWIANPQIQVILLTGGTGFYSTDVTPEAIQPLFDREVPGFGEMFRYISHTEIGMSTIQSRAIAGIANKTLIFSLPGSSGACRTAWEHIIGPQLNQDTKPCNFVCHLDRLPLSLR